MKTCPYCAEEIQDAAIVCKHCGRDLVPTAPPTAIPQTAALPPPKPKKSGIGMGCLGAVGLFLMCGLIASLTRDDTPATTPSPARSIPSPALTPADPFDRANAADDIEVVKSTWEKSGFGNIGMWTVTLKNTSDIAEYADLTYRTEYSAPSGTVVTTHTGKILDRLRPGQTRTFREVNDGFIHSQAERASIRIIAGTKSRPTPQ